jgi:hypothetical protein
VAVALPVFPYECLVALDVGVQFLNAFQNSDLSDQLQHSPKDNQGRNTPILPGFENWLLEYRSRLASILPDETRDTNGG